MREAGRRVVTVLFFLVAATLLGAALGATAAHAIKKSIDY